MVYRGTAAHRQLVQLSICLTALWTVAVLPCKLEWQVETNGSMLVMFLV